MRIGPFRPGPRSIPPGRAPGGIVFHCYDLEGNLLLQRPLRSQAEAAAYAEPDGLTVAELLEQSTVDPADVIVVVYDGDTGKRWDRRDWRLFWSRWGLRP